MCLSKTTKHHIHAKENTLALAVVSTARTLLVRQDKLSEQK